MIESKDPGEVITAVFRYGDELGAAVLSGAVVTVTVVQGVDATPENILQGAAQLSGSDYLQLVRNGLAGVRYKLKSLATLSDGRKLLRVVLLDVRTM